LTTEPGEAEIFSATAFWLGNHKAQPVKSLKRRPSGEKQKFIRNTPTRLHLAPVLI
jgi:hypothetical protein